MSEPDDRDLSRAEAERLRRGDLAALETAYRRLGARVHATCRGLLGNAADAEDAVQEVFLKAFERAAQHHGAGQHDGTSRFSTWLHRIAVNHCLNRLEKERLRRADALPEDELAGSAAPDGDGSDPLDAAHARDAAEIVARRLQQLCDEHRAVLVLREIDGLSYEEIAAVLSIPAGTVMSRLARARERWIALTRSMGAPHAARPARTITELRA